MKDREKTQAPRIVIIDEDPNICQFLGTFLSGHGYPCKAFTEPQKGLNELLHSDWSLALVDLVMPGISGADICQAVLENPSTSNRPILLMTGFPQEAQKLRKTKNRLPETLIKPFSLDALLQRVRSHVGVGTPSQAGICIRGSLRETPFCQLLHNLYTLKGTGLLHLERGSVKKVIYFKEGYPIFARSNLLRECLGRLMVSRNLISAQNCDKSLEMIKKTARLQGTVLIDMGLITPDRLHQELAAQMVEKLLEIFSWPEGEFRYVQGKSFKSGVTAIDVSPANLILQGFKRHSPEARLVEVLAPHRHRYIVQSENPYYRFQDMDLSEWDNKILAKCIGDRTLQELLNQHPLTQPELRHLLAALIITEVVVSRETPIKNFKAISEQPETAPANKKLRESLLRDYSRMIGQDHFELLGVEKSADNETIRQNYFNLAKVYHPDRFQGENLSLDLSEKLGELFQRIGQAYHVLSDPKRKAQYVKELTGKSADKDKVSNILQAETAYQRGLVLIKTKKYEEALQSLEQAVKLSPQESEYLTQWGWVRYKCANGEVEQIQEAKRALIQAIELNPRLDKAHLYLAYLLKEEGKEGEAEKRFELALKSNPKCTEALRELRLLSMRREKDRESSASGGLLGRFFKK